MGKEPNGQQTWKDINSVVGDTFLYFNWQK